MSPEAIKSEAVRDPERAYRAAGYADRLTRDGPDRLKGLCPFHEERTPSFVVFEDGGFKCFGCEEGGDIIDFYRKLHPGSGFREAVERLADCLGVSSPARGSDRGRGPRRPYSLADYAAHVSLPEDVLRAFGVTDGPDGTVHMRYRDEAGKVLRSRVRAWDRRFWSMPDIGGAGSYLYGRDRLADAVEPVIVVEGESDCQVLWHCGFTALGAPGQDVFKPNWVQYVPQCDRLYVLREPRAHLPETVMKAILKASPAAAPEVLEFALEAGDTLDLWREVGCDRDVFREQFEAALDAARPVAEPDDGADDGLSDQPVAVQLVEITLRQANEIFTTLEGDAFVHVPVGEHHEVVRLRDSRFREWVEDLLYSLTGRAAHDSALASARSILAGRARREGGTQALHNRVAWHEEALWYDLSDEGWQAVRIQPGAWEIIDQPPILFRRYPHQQPQVSPVRDGDPRRLLDFVNLRDDHELLFLAFALGCLVPDIAHPVAVFAGPQGSAKTTAARALRRVIDPSALGTLTAPRSEKELVQQLDHNWLAVFDNVSSLPVWLSDALCRASTGAGCSKRQLFTDDSDVIFSFRRCVGLTAVGSPVTQPDLFDRAIIFNMDRVTDTERRLESEFWADFDAALPAILGGAFTAMAEALRVRPSLELGPLPRMADFAAWGAAIAIGLGSTQEEWLEVYRREIADRHRDAIEAGPFASAVAALMHDTQRWRGTATELLAAASQVALSEGISTETPAWPGSARWASERLREAAVNLQELGITVTFDRDRSRRVIELIAERPSLHLLADSGGTAAHDGRGRRCG